MKLQNCQSNLLYVSVPRCQWKFKMLSWNEDVSVFKEALENVNTLKSTSRILTGILSKYSENSELKPNLNS